MNNNLFNTIMNQIDLSNIIVKHESDFLESEKKLKIVPDDLAILIGVEQTMMLCQMDFLIKSHKDDDHFRDGRYWVYETYDDWKRYFPYWGKTKIREIIRKLKDKNLITTGKYNKMHGDNTKWYTVNYDLLDKIMSEKKRLDNTHLSESDTCPLSESDTCHLSENGRPIPNISIPNISIPKNSINSCAFLENAPRIDDLELSILYPKQESSENRTESHMDSQSISYGLSDQIHLDSRTSPIPKDNNTKNTSEIKKELCIDDAPRIDDLGLYMFHVRIAVMNSERIISKDKVVEAMEYFFRQYAIHKGENHIKLKKETIESIGEKLDVFADDLKIMIDRYFSTDFREDYCSLSHFASDNILELKAYETGALGPVLQLSYA